MTSSGIQWRLGVPATASVEEARTALSAPGSEGPAQQWEKARGHLAKRPPDCENSIKDAVGALEGAARILARRPSDTLGQVIKAFGPQLGVHPALTLAIGNLYGYRGDEQAVAHGATQARKDLLPEAELVLHWSAAAIVYLIAKQQRKQT